MNQPEIRPDAGATPVTGPQTGPDAGATLTGPDTGVDASSDGRLPASVVEAIERLEADERIDPLAERLHRVADTVVRSEATDNLLTGAWMGHAAHPLMTDFPLGAWTSATLLDLLGGKGSRRAAAGLMTFGVVTAVPTVATGLAELRRLDQGSRRVAAVHAATNSVALGLYTASLLSRRRHHMRAVWLGVTGGLVATVGGYLGGHLTLVRKAGTRDERFSTPDDVVAPPVPA